MPLTNKSSAYTLIKKKMFIAFIKVLIAKENIKNITHEHKTILKFKDSILDELLRSFIPSKQLHVEN